MWLLQIFIEWVSRILFGGGINRYAYVENNPLKYSDSKGLYTHEDINDDEKLGVFVGGEINILGGVGATVVSCTDDCNNDRKMLFKKYCIGLAVNVSASVGIVSGIDGANCRPDVYDDWFLESGVSFGKFGVSFDVSIPGGEVVEIGASPGLGVQLLSGCNYIYVKDL